MFHSVACGLPVTLPDNGVDMRRSPSGASALEKQLERHLANRMAPSTSRVPAIYRETTICYSYMCPYAYGCSEKTNRPAQVMMRRCMRYMPESLRIRPGMSDMALDILARLREQGELLSAHTTSVLDEVRPNGPLRKV